MASNVTLNGISYIIPAYNDTGWAQGAGNLSLYLVALATATLQPTGGAFTLTSELDFGPNFGVKQLYLKTETALPAATGVVRLASADTIKWRNNANSADVSLSKDTSDNLLFAATKVLLSGAVLNADINAGAAIAYSKLALAGSILNADVSASAAIAYSKLALTGNIVNADIASAAAIAVNKMAALTASRVMVTDASGFSSASTVTTTTLGFLDATSSVQTQLNATVANPLPANLNFNSHKGTNVTPGTASTDIATFGQVKYLQAVQNTTATKTTSTSASYVDVTNHTVTITPTSASNRVKLTFTFVVESASAGSGFLTLVRGSTDLGAANGFAQIFAGDPDGFTTLALTYIDSPATVSSTVYKLQLKTSGGASISVGTTNVTSVMLAEEIV
jgi:hypothetical protein